MHRLRQWLTAPFAHRSLFRSFVRQEVQGRFAGSMGGLFWSVLTPVANILIYVFVFSVVLQIRIIQVETGTDQFVIYLLSGLLPWLAFAEALRRATTLLLEKASLITKVSFPVELLPVVGGVVPFILNGAGFGVFLIYLITQGYAHAAWVWLPAVVLLHILFTLGLVALLSAVSVFLRDMQQIVGVIVFLWMYLTPIIYPLALVPGAYRHWLLLNPAFPFIELYRQVLLQHALPPGLLAAAVALAGASFLVGGWFFMRIKHAFGDVL